MKAGYDYIIVGAGSSGCVLAARLSEDAAVKVLLIEAGGSEKRAKVAMPLAWFKAMNDPAIGWGYETEPEPHANDRVIPVPRGRVVGGCSSINGMMYSRGHARDYDLWAQKGLSGWSFDAVLPYFARSEDSWRGASRYHGTGGPLTVAQHKVDDHIYPALAGAASDMGHSVLDDFHGEKQEGFSVPDFNVHKGHRGSTAARFLRPALSRPNLDLVSEALVHRVVIENGRAVGVELSRRGRMETVRASRETILSAGAYGSPKILMLSGVGPAEELRDVGVMPLVDLPGVGRNLQEHASVGHSYDAAGDFTFDRELRFDRLARSVFRWQLTGTGPVAGLPVGIQGFVRTREGLDRPDLQMLVSPVAMNNDVWCPGIRASVGSRFSVANVLLHPQSRGWVKLASNDPAAKPRIQLNLLSEEADRLAFRRFIGFTRDFFATPSAKALIKGAVLPPDALKTNDEIDGYVRAAVRTAMHPTSTCAMGTGPNAVLDASLCVYGVDGLRVVDCSSMPDIPGGNTQAPAIMLAEKAADLISGRAAPRPVSVTQEEVA